MHSCIFQIRIWLSAHNAHARFWLWDFFLTCMRCYNQKCINKSENAANRATKSSNTGSGLVCGKGLTEVLSVKKKAFISETGEQKRGVMWWRFRLSCFTVGGLERQMRRIVKSSRGSCFSAHVGAKKRKMRQQNTGRERRVLRLACYNRGVKYHITET